jgi:uncharacterized protein YaiI (UPF0178 family)
VHIYVDADACPVKQEVCRVAGRHGVPVTFVSNSWIPIPSQPSVRLEVVDRQFDAADDWIAGRTGSGDVVVTSDIPLASRCIKVGAQVVNPHGRVLDENNIGEIAATRDLLTELRSGGVATGGPPPFEKKDRSRFLQNLDQVLHRIKRDEKGS